MIRNIKDLENMVNKYMVKALELTRDEVFEIISRKITDYYYEDVFSPPDTSEPDVYQRTGKLMESLTASHITKNGNGYEFTVGFDDEYLSFHYSGGFTTKKYGSKYNGITGEQVLQALNTGTHGYTVPGSHNYWDEALMEIDQRGGIQNIFKRNMKKLGVPIMN